MLLLAQFSFPAVFTVSFCFKSDIYMCTKSMKQSPF